MSRDRDVQVFDHRAAGYEGGYRGQLHHDIVVRSVELLGSWFPSASRVLDIGCGTGMLLRELAERRPDATMLTGIDAAGNMVARAQSRGHAVGRRLSYCQAVVEQLPFADGAFDLVISTTSFDHWADQESGLAECRRVLTRGGHLVLTDIFSPWLLPALSGAGRGRARTPLRATRLLAEAGFRSITWHRHYAVIIRSVIASAC